MEPMLLTLSFLCLAPQAAPTALSPADVSPTARFGNAVDLDGDTAVIGAVYDSTAGQSSGSVHFYERSSGAWSRTFLQRGSPSDGLGASVAVDGDVAAVGRGFTLRGVVIYERQGGTWAQTGVLTYPGDPVSNPQFGADVAVSGDRIAVGSPTASEGGVLAGAVYLYERSTTGWNLAETFVGTLPGGSFPTSPNLGRRVELEGDTLVASAPRTNVSGTFSAGQIHVFERGTTGWTETVRLASPPSLEVRDLGGRGMELDGDTLAVAAVGYDNGALTGVGIVEVFTRQGTTWAFSAPVHNPTPSRSAAFGIDLALSADRLMVARSGYHVMEFSDLPLTLESFERTGPGIWRHQATLHDPHSGPDRGFGSAVALDNTTLMAPAVVGFGGGISRGKVYVTETTTPWDIVSSAVCPGTLCSCPSADGWAGCGNSTVNDGWLFGDGTASLAADDFRLVGRQLPVGRMARLRAGPILAPPSLFGDGDFCVQRAVEFPVQTIGFDGTSHFGPDLVAQAAAAGSVILPGETWYFQLLYDDPVQVYPCHTWYAGSPFGLVWNGRPVLTAGGFNLTNAVSVTWKP